MAYSRDAIKERIKQPRNQSILKVAAADNAWCRFHARNATRIGDLGSHFFRFRDKVHSIITVPKKQDTFWKVFDIPLISTNIIQDAADELNRVFTANDRYEEMQFATPELAQDFREYLQKSKLGSIDSDRVFNLVMEQPTTFAVLDLPAEQTTLFPEPFVTFLEADQVHDAEKDNAGNVDLIIYKTDLGFVGIDDAFYRVFDKDTFEYKSEVAHFLGYCPACLIWGDLLSGSNGLRTLGPIIPMVSLLDRYAMQRAFERDVDLYAAFPSMQVPEETCNYVSSEGSRCSGGYFKKAHNEYGVCPDCEARKHRGPGTVYYIKPAMLKDGVTKVASFIEASTDPLKYYTEKNDELEKRLYEMLTGKKKQDTRKDAVNQDQIKDEFEARKSKLNYWAENMQTVRTFIISTAAKLRYGNAFVSYVFKNGDQYHLETLTDMLDEFDRMKKSGLPVYLLDEQLKKIEALIVRNNNTQEKRLAIMRLLEPYRNLSLSLLDPASVEYRIKADLPQLIEQFEMDNNITIEEFGSKAKLSDKLKSIQTQLIRYAKQRSGLSITPNLGGGSNNPDPKRVEQVA
ncbi:hypothetical protein [Runella sp.]|uniref:hypothetical protein n=1 Tax=Runella sp. TaxID=1960881 RepID=UPI003D0CAA29